MLPNDFRARFLLVWLIPLLIAALSGCAGMTGVAKALPVRPDPALLQPCPEPEGSAETNGTLAQWFLDMRAALQQCNNQITTFKETSNGHSQ